jgi:hypothetical protein
MSFDGAWVEHKGSVDLSNQNIGGWNGVRGIGEAWDTRELGRVVHRLATNRVVTSLDLKHNHLNPEAMVVLSELFTLRRFMQLRVRGNTIEFEQAMYCPPIEQVYGDGVCVPISVTEPVNASTELRTVRVNAVRGPERIQPVSERCALLTKDMNVGYERQSVHVALAGAMAAVVVNDSNMTLPEFGVWSSVPFVMVTKFNGAVLEDFMDESGEDIMAIGRLVQARYGGGAEWRDAKVADISEDLTYVLRYDGSGKMEKGVGRHRMKCKADVAPAAYKSGQRVDVRRKDGDGDRWAEATITKVSGDAREWITYDVAYQVNTPSQVPLDPPSTCLVRLPAPSRMVPSLSI